MIFTKRLREGIRRGRITCSVRIWARRHVKVGGRYPMDDGHIVVDSIAPITMREVTGALARESGFDSRNDLLQVARHGKGCQVFLIRFHYLAPGAWDSAPKSVSATRAGSRNTRQAPLARRNTRAPKDAFSLVRTLAQRLPEVEEGTAYGSPALKVRGKMFACIAIHRSAEPNTLVVQVDFEQRDELLADDPGTYYIADHYVAYPCVLVRLSRIHPDALSDLLSMGWRFASAATRRRQR
jgi:hypothetical protein